MIVAKFYAVILNQANGVNVPNERIEAALAAVVSDWMRFNFGQYIVLSDQGAKAVYQAISAILPPPSKIMVVATDIRDRHGWADQIVVEWMTRHAP